MIFARNNIEVTERAYRENRTFNLDAGVQAQKLTVQLLSANRQDEFVYGPVVIQVTEEPQHLYEDELNTEQFLELGFNSRGFATPITGFRVRLPDLADVDKAQNALLHFVFYG